MYRNISEEFDSQQFLPQSIQEVWLISRGEKSGYLALSQLFNGNLKLHDFGLPLPPTPVPALAPAKLEHPRLQSWATEVHVPILPEHTQPQHLLIFILEQR